jgi:hypothetical protein
MVLAGKILLSEPAHGGLARCGALVVRPDTGSSAMLPVQQLNPANTETELENPTARP